MIMLKKIVLSFTFVKTSLLLATNRSLLEPNTEFVKIMIILAIETDLLLRLTLIILMSVG